MSFSSTVFRYWPSAIIAVALASVAAVNFSETLRAAIAIACIALAVCQARRFSRAQRYSISGLVLLSLLLTSLWLLLNVVRYYTYGNNPEIGLHPFVIKIQDFLVWILVAAILIAALWTFTRIAGWIASLVS